MCTNPCDKVYIKFTGVSCVLPLKTAAHLPPLGRNKDARPPLKSSSFQPQPSKDQQHLHLLRASRPPPGDTECFSSTCPETTGYPRRAGSGWVSTADIFLQGGEAAGITFQWTEISPATAGLSVVGIADGSVAAKNNHVVAGMFLVEVNHRRVTGIVHDEIMRVMHTAASHPRVLTLARMGSSQPPPAQPRCISISGTPDTGTWPEKNASSGCTKRSPTPDQLSATSPSAVAAADDATNRGRATLSGSLGQPASGESMARFSSHLAKSSSAEGKSLSVGGSASSVASSVTPLDAEISSGRSATTETTTLQNNCAKKERTLPLRFVGSRGHHSLYDRDHILGLKKRNIEFVPISASASRSSRANSRRSLGELAIDWRNDPCSTPARRRRLIHDVCRVVAGSYVHASAARVAELRRQQALATRIQAASRMWVTRRRFVARLTECRATAALCLQLGWLSYAARRLVSVLREERDHARRVDEVKRKRRLAREEAERRQHDEERKRAEREAQEEEERRRRKQELVVFVQRRFRALKASIASTTT